jgi:NAD(P)-dependent dehydrogenase (short-subunit alcohol dehydrogenase family)
MEGFFSPMGQSSHDVDPALLTPDWSLDQGGLRPACIVKLDVRDRSSVVKTLAGLPPEFSEIDILVNNAGLSLGLEPAYQTELEDWETMVDTNIKSRPLGNGSKGDGH